MKRILLYSAVMLVWIVFALIIGNMSKENDYQSVVVQDKANYCRSDEIWDAYGVHADSLNLCE